MKGTTFLLVLVLITFLTFNCNAQFTTAWTVINDPSAYCTEHAHAIALDGTGIYVAGSENNPPTWRVEKRNLATGTLTWSINDGATRHPNAVAVDATGVYVAGSDLPGCGDSQWRIQKRTLAGAVSWTVLSNPFVNCFSDGGEQPNGMAVNGSGVYVVGFDANGGTNDRWRIEKRNLASPGGLIASFGTGGVVASDPSTSDDAAYAITLDATGIYVCGNEGGLWRVEKRNLTTGALIWSQTVDPTGFNDDPHAIAVDASGVYIAGTTNLGTLPTSWRIEKRDLTTGALICNATSSNSGKVASAITVNASGVYVGGRSASASCGGGGDCWHIEKFDFTCGFLAPCSESLNIGTNNDAIDGLASNTTEVYAAGWATTCPGTWVMKKYTDAGCTTVLPIKLLSFTANCNENNTIEVKWQTATEINNDFFTIERSTDGVNFETAGMIKGAGNSNITRNYQYIDVTSNPPVVGQALEPQTSNTLYYRLKQTDFDGQFEYFDVVDVKNCEQKKGTFSIYPNPANHSFSFMIQGSNEDLLLEVYNHLGAVVIHQAYTNLEKGTQHTIKTNELAQGIYLVKFSQGVNQQSGKLIINR